MQMNISQRTEIKRNKICLLLLVNTDEKLVALMENVVYCHFVVGGEWMNSNRIYRANSIDVEAHFYNKYTKINVFRLLQLYVSADQQKICIPSLDIEIARERIVESFCINIMHTNNLFWKAFSQPLKSIE